MTNAISTATITNLPSVAALRIRITLQSSTINESWIIDNVEISGATAVTWTGITNNLWSVASNWSPNEVPNSATNVVINTGTPILDVNYTVPNTKTLTVSGTGSLTINPTNTLSVAGTAAFNSRPIILKSNISGTASIGAVTGSLTGATNVTVERFLQGRRAARFLTPSVTSTTSIRANWQNGGTNTAGVGTHITGSTTGANGFDATASGNPSMFTYNAQATGTTSGFTAIANTDVATLTAGVGYRILVRGDRNVNLTAASANDMNAPTTLSTTGSLRIGTVSFTSASGPSLVNNQATNTQTAGFTLIGNPYVCPVDWHAVTKTGVAADAYYTWDPTLGTASQRGRYVVYSQTSGTASLLVDNSGLQLNNRRYLQTGQAVFIKNAVLSTPATLTFNESNKASNSQFVFRVNPSANSSNNATLQLSVFEPSELALGGSPIDGATAIFGADFDTALDGNDVEKLTAAGENLAFSRNNKNLSIETLGVVQANEELLVSTIAFEPNKNYIFRTNVTNFNSALTAKLVDKFLNTETAISLTQTSFLNFNTNASPASYAADRFKIVLSNSTLSNDKFLQQAISVYPNPVQNNEFTLALPSTASGKVSISITNMLGQQVYKVTSDAAPTMQIQPNQILQQGVYVVSVDMNGSVSQTKVIVRN